MKLKLASILAVLALALAACAPAAATPQPTSAASFPAAPATAAPLSIPSTIPSTATPAPAASATVAPAPTTAPTFAPTASYPLTLTDGLGREVKLDAPAQKVVSLAPSNTEILFSVGAGQQVVGRDEFSNYPPESTSLPSVGGSMGKYDLEAVAKLQPDLVLAAEINTPEQVKALENLGLKVYYLSNPKDFDGMYHNLELVGQMTGHEADAQALVASLKSRVDAVIMKVAVSSYAPKVFYELDGSDPSKPWTSGPGTYMDQMIAMANGYNVASGLKQSWGQISQEELLVENPDIILLGDGAYGVTPEQVAQRPGWSAINAVKNNKILTFDDNLVSRPDARLVDGLETLAKLMHPELYK